MRKQFNSIWLRSKKKKQRQIDSIKLLYIKYIRNGSNKFFTSVHTYVLCVSLLRFSKLNWEREQQNCKKEERRSVCRARKRDRAREQTKTEIHKKYSFIRIILLVLCLLLFIVRINNSTNTSKQKFACLPFKIFFYRFWFSVDNLFHIQLVLVGLFFMFSSEIRLCT